MANMEELHMAASAYYTNASGELRQLATEFFNSMDANGDGGVSFDEFIQFFVQNGYNRVDPNFFRSLDRNGDGFLDFFEALTFYYIFKTRGVSCGYCRIGLMGLYFTCVACFDNAGGSTYDLCSTCYEARRHQQQHPHHNYFLDSYVLLRAKACLPLLTGAPNLQQALVQHAPSPNISQRALVSRSAPNTPQQCTRFLFEYAFRGGGHHSKHWRVHLMLGVWLLNLVVASCDGLFGNLRRTRIGTHDAGINMANRRLYVFFLCIYFSLRFLLF